MTREQALAVMAPILAYLREEEVRNATLRESDDWSEYSDPPGAPHWDLASDLCHAMLEAANRDGLCGCRLCRS